MQDLASKSGFILIVDDSLPDRDMLSRRLQRAGCITVTANSGEEALRVLQHTDFDLVLLDVTMPGIDGLSVLEQVRRKRSMTELPIMIVTARDDNKDIVRGLQLGANDYIMKPLDFPVVLSRVQTHLLVKTLNGELENHRNRAKRELQAAARLHRSVPPKVLPTARDFRFSLGFYPCEDVAGDVLDIIQLDKNHIACCLLDVTGRGVEAALLSLSLSRTLSHLGPDSLLFKQTVTGEIEIVPPAAVAATLNRRFANNVEAQQSFALFYGILDLERNEFRFVSAGHIGAVHVPDQQPPVVLSSTGCGIGLFKDTTYEESAVQLGPGDRFYMYSDGVTNAPNATGDSYGSRLMNSVHEGCNQPLDSSLSQLVHDVREWCAPALPNDDIAVLAFELKK
jgi:sigma-B regulation protein RsbU (phosphoserine phosphatase)